MLKTIEIIIPSKISVFTDKKTRVKTIGLPFVFPDTTNGVISITKLVQEDWSPYKQVKSIVINFI